MKPKKLESMRCLKGTKKSTGSKKRRHWESNEVPPKAQIITVVELVDLVYQMSSIIKKA